MWSPDGRLLALRGLGPGDAQAWLATAGAWSLHRLGLPPGAYVVDWLDATPGVPGP